MRRAAAFVSGLLLVVPTAGAQELARDSAQDSAHDRAQVEAGWVAALVDHPLERTGDDDAIAADLLDRVQADPGHDLVQGTLRRIEARHGRLEDPARLVERLLDVSSEGMQPSAVRQLARMQGRALALRVPVDEMPDDAYPEWFGRFLLLGPIGSVHDALAFRDPVPQLREPGFLDEHEGIDGPVSWREVQRSPTSQSIVARANVRPWQGQVLVAAVFDVPRGGPAWIEIEWRAGNDRDAAYALSANGEPPTVVDEVGAEIAPLRHHAVVLREGRNRVVVQQRLGWTTAFALRVLTPDGRRWPGLVEIGSLDEVDAPLGTPVEAELPRRRPWDTAMHLAAKDTLSADEEALLGRLLDDERREAAGLARVRAAVELAPEREGLAVLHASMMRAAAYLPSTWKRGRVRAIYESVLEQDPERLDVGLYMVDVLADEDREEEALGMLAVLERHHPERSAVQLAAQDLYAELGMTARAEAALLHAQELAPGDPDVLRRLVRLHERHGQRTRAAELHLAAVRADESTGSALVGAARRFVELGDFDRAESLYREAIRRDPTERNRHLALAEFLVHRGADAEADALFAELQDAWPEWDRPPRERADLALRRGDYEAEQRFLREALARTPGLAAARARLHDFTGEEPTEVLFAQERLDLDALREAYDDEGRDDSVVKIVDHAVLALFEDGSSETLTQDLWIARDLDGCETLGRRSLSGDVERIATIKADGSVYEPVSMGRSYIMPNLEPGDFVVAEYRSFRSAPSRGIVRPGSWRFASTQEPYLLSSYVISVPHALPLRLEQRRFDGEHERRQAGGSTLHSFRARDQERVLPERLAPPDHWYLPWIEFGMDADPIGILSDLALSVREPTRVTPEIRDAIEPVVDGLMGDDARARALHAFVNETLDQRGSFGATAALLQREGNASYLYSALLTAAGVPHELVFSRNLSPEADPDPEPAFVESGRLNRKLVVLVEPRDAPAAWCDMDARAMPYGRLMDDAPRATALAVPSMRRLQLPDVPLALRPTLNYAFELRVSADGAADVEGVARFAAGLGFVLKEPIREIPQAFRKNWVTQVLAQVLPGLDLADWDIPGLDDPETPMGIRASGRVPAFLDDDGRSLVCALPFPALNLTGQLAGGEGERRLPYLLGEPWVQEATVRMELGEGLDVLEVPQDVSVAVHGGHYELRFERTADGALSIRRVIALPAFSTEADGYLDFAAFCARVDEAERAQLRFARAADDVDPSGTSR